LQDCKQRTTTYNTPVCSQSHTADVNYKFRGGTEHINVKTVHIKHCLLLLTAPCCHQTDSSKSMSDSSMGGCLPDSRQAAVGSLTRQLLLL
jgi:hypothetical protein